MSVDNYQNLPAPSMSGGDSLQISTLRSFQELTDEDKQRCYVQFLNEPLQQKHIQNKYIKRTEQIEIRAPLDNESFLTFDLYPLNYKFSVIVFSLCGITNQFQYVIYMSVIEDSKLDNMDQFVCDLLANLIMAEVPKLKRYSLKFVLCRDNPLNVKVLTVFAHSKKTAKLFNAFPFIREPTVLRRTLLHDPYSQLAWLDIMQGNIEQTTVRDIFRKHRELAELKENEILKQFVNEFFTVARDLLDSRFQINLRLCTMERMDNFQHIVLAHMKSYKEQAVSRLFLFELIRALIHIYGF